jgi:O-antigen/teichoic acid export membrane protein
MKRLVELRRSPLARNSGWLMLGQGASVVLLAGYFIQLARLLGTMEYGVLVGAAAIVAMVSQYGSLGSGLLFLRYVSPDHKSFSLYWGNILLMTFACGPAIVLALHFLAGWLVGPESVTLVTVLAISELLGGSLVTCIGQVFQTFEKLRVTAALNLLTNGLRFVLVTVLLYHWHHTSALQWAYASLCVTMVAVLVSVSAVFMSFGAPSFHPRVAMARLGEGFTFAISGSTTSAYNDLDKVLLGHYHLNAANGVYSMAYRVVDVCTIPIRAIQGAVVPRLFRLGKGGTDQAFALSVKILRRTVPISVVAALGMVVCAPIIPHLVGNGFSQSVFALRWLCLIPLFRALHMSAGDALTSAGHQRFRLGSQATMAAINLGLNLYLIPRYSWRGAAWSSVFTDGCLGLLNWGLLIRFRAKHGAQHRVAV